MMKKCLLLFAHGSRDPEWVLPVEAIATTIRHQNSDIMVATAYLEFCEPTLEAAIDHAYREGVREIQLVPVFIALGGHLKRDLPQMLSDFANRHPGLNIKTSAPIGAQVKVQSAIAAAALQEMS